MTDFIFLGSKITSDGDRNHEIKRCLLLGRKVMTNLDSILKIKRHHFANKGPYKHMEDMLKVFLNDSLSEFYYYQEEGIWKYELK